MIYFKSKSVQHYIQWLKCTSLVKHNTWYFNL